MEQEFIKQVLENERIILKICNVYCKEQEDREDLYQDILVQVWKSFATFDNKSKITTWLYRIALNTAITRYRKLKKTPYKEPITEQLTLIPDADTGNRHENVDLLYTAIESLNKVEKAIILLYLEDAKYKEIAEIIGISESNVGFKINNIKGKLYKKLKLSL